MPGAALTRLPQLAVTSGVRESTAAQGRQAAG